MLMLIFTGRELLKFSETGAYGYDPTSFVRSKGTINFSLVLEAQRYSRDLMAQGCPKNASRHGSKQKMVWLSDDNFFMMIELKKLDNNS